MRAILAGMARRHAVAVAIKQHAGKEAGLAHSSAALAPGSIAGELLLNGIPQRLIDDRRVFAGMELALVNAVDEVISACAAACNRRLKVPRRPRCDAGSKLPRRADGAAARR